MATKQPPIKIKRPGALTAKANKAGSSVKSFAKANLGAPGLTGKQAQFAVNAAKWNKKGK